MFGGVFGGDGFAGFGLGAGGFLRVGDGCEVLQRCSVLHVVLRLEFAVGRAGVRGRFLVSS